MWRQAEPKNVAPGLILAIETSCDDTCAAVLDGPRVLSSVISSQAAAHAQFGGVVPEVASRHHLELAAPVVEAALAEAGVALDEIDAVAVTAGPGLIGALLVGVSTAKAIAAPRRLPLIPVDHLQGHVAANFLEPEPLQPPFLCLVASGGHTMLAGVRDHAGYELLGQTLDDAAGEAFDKVARMLGLGYPGGPALEKLAREGDPEAFPMPVAMSRDPGLDFSFSGLKTALVYLTRDLGPDRARGAPRRPRRQLPGRRRRPAGGEAGAGAEARGVGGRRARRRSRRQRPAARGGAGALRAPRRTPQARRPRALHRQRSDDRLRRPLRRPDPLPRLPRLRRLRQRREGRRVTQVTVYSRPQCHLCEQAIEALLGLHEEGYRFELHEVDIESEELLFKRMLEKIPVVEVDGAGRLRADPRPRRGRGEARYCGGVSATIEEQDAAGGLIVDGERLSLGVAARLSRYLQVLTQARKMGRETISSQELSEYTHINPTQIRRDLSGFGKFGKRGVGYNVESLVAEIRKILRTSGQHNIALFGAGNLGQAIASSDIFADHGFQIVAMFDVDESVVGSEVGGMRVREFGELEAIVAEQEIVVGVLAVPAAAAQAVADRLVEAGVKIIFNYSEQLLQVPPEVTVHTSSPAVDLLYALYFYLT